MNAEPDKELRLFIIPFQLVFSVLFTTVFILYIKWSLDDPTVSYDVIFQHSSNCRLYLSTIEP